MIVHCKKSRYDIYIGRPSRWGNPFIIGKDGDRKEVIRKYEKWILKQPELLKDICLLKNKTLGCYCAPLSCHGDILLKLVNKLCIT